VPKHALGPPLTLNVRGITPDTLREGTDHVHWAGSPARSRPPVPPNGDPAVQDC
jgi:hypothetical protein